MPSKRVVHIVILLDCPHTHFNHTHLPCAYAAPFSPPSPPVNIPSPTYIHSQRQWYERIRRPTMVLNALDDMVSVKDNIRIDLAEQHPGFVLLLTRFGSHVAFERDLTSFDSSYMFEVSIDFLETVRRLKHEEKQKTEEQQEQTTLAQHRPAIQTT